MKSQVFKYAGVVFVVCIIFIFAYGVIMSEKPITLPDVTAIPESAWQKLAEKKIFFGHQSVGDNILEGIRDIIAQYPVIQLNIVETDAPEDFETAIFAHSKVGENMKPHSKIDAFARIMEQGIGQQADIAFFKFCYVDFHNNTNIKEVFQHYTTMISQVKKAFPQLKVIHVTVPLTSQQRGPRAWVKKVIGKPLRGYEDNIIKNQFNELLRKAYDGQDPIFDLAQIESTFSDGERSSFTQDRITYYSMVQAYTDDGGHLNEVGRKVAAAHFLMFLANLKP